MIKTCWKIAAVSILVSTLVCGPVGIMSLSTVLAKADAAVVGTVVQSAVTNTELSVDVNVLRSIKGDEQPFSSVHLTYSFASPIWL